MSAPDMYEREIALRQAVATFQASIGTTDGKWDTEAIIRVAEIYRKFLAGDNGK